MNALLDTHFLIWITLESKKLERFRWLGKYLPWGVSPFSLLELQYLSEVGRLRVKLPEFSDALMRDRRFVVDEAPLVALIRRSFQLSWTRDPFDRLLAAHSLVRRVPLCTVDQIILENHPLLPEEVAEPSGARHGSG